MCLLFPKQGSITVLPKLVNLSPSFKTQSEAPSPAPRPFLHPLLPPVYIPLGCDYRTGSVPSHWQRLPEGPVCVSAGTGVS